MCLTAAAAAAAAAAQIVADQVMFQVPHDEMPMRVYLFCETWAKAVSQVRVQVCLLSSMIINWGVFACLFQELGADGLALRSNVDGVACAHLFRV